MLVVNFFGPPCAGKTTHAPAVFSLLKRDYVSSKYIPEFADELIQAGGERHLTDQAFVFGNQHHRLQRLVDLGIQVAVMDSPILLSAYYAPAGYPESFRNFVWEMFSRYENFNVFLHRNHAYSMLGRVHTAEQSDRMGPEILEMLESRSVPIHLEARSSDDVPAQVYQALRKAKPAIWEAALKSVESMPVRLAAGAKP
jgi:adenylate kinase family enzyme